MHAIFSSAGARLGALFCLFLALCAAGPGLALERDPAPPAAASLTGPATYAPDLAPPFSGKAVAARPDFLRPDFSRQKDARKLDALKRDDRIPEDGNLKDWNLKDRDRDAVGGDDVLVNSFPWAYYSDLAVSTSGDLYAAVQVDPGEYNYGLRVYRSADDGHTWSLWSTLADPDPDVDFTAPSLILAEGVVDRIFLAWVRNDVASYSSTIQVAVSPLGGAASWTISDVFTQPGYCNGPDLATDAGSYSSYYVYLSFQGSVSAPSEIYFARTTDQGATWQAPYIIASLNYTDRAYWPPVITYGYGGYVHVAYIFHTELDGFDDAVRYQRAPNFASGGQAAWSGIYGLSSATDGLDDKHLAIGASQAGNQVLVGFDRYEDGTAVMRASQMAVSEEQGLNFADPQELPLYRLGSVVQNPANDNWLVSGAWSGLMGFIEATAADLATWSEHHTLGDVRQNYDNAMVLHAGHAYQPSMVWIQIPDTEYEIRWDATWRGGEGYPNLEDGFPVDLAYQPVTDPTLADLDRDGRLEVIFADEGGYVHAFQHDGTELPGWPAILPQLPAANPVAVGDMNGDGELEILVGTALGWVAGYTPAGDMARGWPVITGSGQPVSVTIANLGGPYPRVAVLNDGETIQFVNYAGRPVPGTTTWDYSAYTMGQGVAVGDIDGNGVNEVVYCVNNVALARAMTGGPTLLYRQLSAYPSAPPSLGDFDLDGDEEVAVPLQNGQVYVLNDDGTDFPGAWPYDSGIGEPMSRIALAQCAGGFEPELAVCSRNWTTFLLWEDGTDVAGYPVNNDSWFIFGGPVMAHVEGSSGDVVVGARGSKGWAWSNGGDLIPGWPRFLDNHCQLTPAVGDLDRDSSNEIVFLTLDQLVVVDVNHAPAPEAYRTWNMAAHDAANTGCSDCPEDLVSPVQDDAAEGGITRVSFAAPSPNPMSGPATFRFAVPVRAVVELAVYDVRGRRVALVQREESTPGRHVVEWNGRDGRGHPLASGNYLATLKVRGPGLDQTLTRKVTVLR